MRSGLAALGLAGVALAMAACGGQATGQAHLQPAGHTQAAGMSLPGTPGTMSSGPAPTVTTSPAPAVTTPAGGSASAPQGTIPVRQGARNSARPRISFAPSRLSAYTAESWTAEGAGPVRDVTGHDIELNECASVHGAATWQQEPYLSSGGNSAILESYTFADAAAAKSAYAGVLSGMRSCQATSRALQASGHVTPDAASRQTASSPGAAAFERTWTGVQGVSAAGPQANHLYVAEQGTTVAVLHFDELTSGTSASPYDVRNDPSVLSMLTSVLANGVGAG